VSSLGSFGKPKPQRDDGLSFDFFDQEVRIDPSFGQLDFIDFMESAASVDEDDPSAMVVIKDMLRKCVHQDDFEQFWKTARTERQSVTDLMEVVYAAVAAVAERPTSQPSDSSDGLLSDAPNSTDDSSLQVIDLLERQGRPDKAQMVAQAQKARAAV
jgi:hypothetical protein